MENVDQSNRQIQNTGHGLQVTSQRSLFYQYRNNPNRLQMVTLGLKAFFKAKLGLRLSLALMNV